MKKENINSFAKTPEQKYLQIILKTYKVQQKETLRTIKGYNEYPNFMKYII